MYDGWSRLYKDLNWQRAYKRTLPVSLVMVRAIREYHEKTGYKIGYKPAGGISKAKDALRTLA